MEIPHLTRQLLVFKEGTPPSVHSPQRGQIRCCHVELLAEMAPQDGGHDAHGIEDAATHPQKADLQRQSQLQGRLPPLLNELPFGRREREERLDLEGRQLTRDLLQTEKCGLPRAHCTLLGWGAIASQKSGAASNCFIGKNLRSSL